MAFIIEEIMEDESERSDDRSERRLFMAMADNDGESTYTARSAPGLPIYKEPHDENPAVRARRICAERVNNATRLFRVTVEYEQFSAPDTDDEDPLLDVVRVSYRRTSVEKPYNRAMFVGTIFERINEDGETYLSSLPDSDVEFVIPDNNDGLKIQSVLNSAGSPFSSFLPKRRHLMTLIATRNEENPNLSLISEWQEAVNSDEFQGAVPGTLLLEIDIGEEETRGGVTYRPVSYIMTQSIEPTGWDDAIQDKGFSYLKEFPVEGEDPGFRITRIVDPEDGIGTAEEQLLNGLGHVLDPQKPDFSLGANPGILSVYRVYRPYMNRRNFADLNLEI